ncbi:hypothetical protein NQ318_015667 [Aromia moschata]|uniref:Integrator complex subunit 5 n=1 Tax=Aromia moschata TaxID=1265417 RepID=A0AAV8XQN1_9CUCU|nr:hypothetical protein NQ318_015667 [Aromia moschata]
MACRATRTLVDINTKCLSSLIHSNTEACISALFRKRINTSVKHSPNFDWVVAHVGSCFPNTVITRVLSCGLKDFCQNKSYDQGCNSPKLKSVVGILGHLAGSHVQDIRKAILEMFTWSLRETFEDTDAVRLQKKATVPYILQLVYLSSTLLSSICVDTKNTLKVEVIGRLYHFIEDWCKYFGTPEALEELITTLILRCESGGIQIIHLLLDCILVTKIRGSDQMKNDIIEKAKEILQNVLYEIDESIRHNNPVEIMSSFSKEINEINNMLLSPSKVVYEMAGQLVVFLGTSKKIKGFKKVNRILKRLCTYSKVAKVLALRELLERALFRNDNGLFGAVNNEHDDEDEKMLLKQNKKINKTIPLTKHSSVFNGGIIGSGKRKSIAPEQLPADIISDNIYHLINAIKACCALPEEHKYTDMSLDSMTLLSLLLVQFVSPDVMYNGLPWPEEEFSKVTMERDLFIRRMFANTPLLWELLSFVAVYRPAICYCSVIIRALTATLIHQWKSMGEQSKDDDSENYKMLMETTIKVIDVMALGQLLPPPLSSIRDVIPLLKCYEIVAILRESVWCYMRDHIPSPALFGCDSNGINWRDPIIARPPEVYTNTLRIIMQRNIKSLGHMYAQMFINIPRHE